MKYVVLTILCNLLYYFVGMSTIANGTVRVLTTPVLSNISKVR